MDPDPILASLQRSFPQYFLLKKYRKGETIFEEGQEPEFVYLLKAGLVKAVKFTPQSESFTMEIVFPNHLFGMIAVMDRKPYPVSAVAMRDCEACAIPAQGFEALMRQVPEFSAKVFAQIGDHVRHAQAMRAIAKEPAEKRIAYLLLLLAEALGERIQVRREDIADMASCTPETAIRVLADLKRKKLIRSGWKWVTVAQPDRLRKLSSL